MIYWQKKQTKPPERLNALYEEWTKNHVSKLAIQTQSFYSDLWKNHLKDKSNIKLKSITPKHIYDILDNVKARGIDSGDRTRQALFKMLKAMLNKAVKWGYLASNPCHKIDTPKYQAPEKEIFNDADLDKMLKLLPSQELKYQSAAFFAVLCGLRREEIVGLKWNDIDFENKTLKIKRAAVQEKGRGTVEGNTKTESSKRELRLPNELIPLLKRIKSEQAQKKLKLGEKWINEDWIFTQWNGKLLNLATVSAWWSDFVNENKLKKITFHDLRHTAASYLIKSGTDIITVSKILGHAKPSTTTNIYGHVVEDAKKEALSGLESIIMKNKKTV